MILTKIDLRNAYHQVRVKEGDEWKTPLRCRKGHFEYQVYPQGPTNAPAMFQSFMNEILREYLDLIAVGIPDDIIIFSESVEEHIQHVRSILTVLREHKLYAKVEKCEFHKDRMTFVGYMVSTEGIGMDPAKVSALAAYDYAIVYRKGASNGTPDALSRRPDYLPPPPSPPFPSSLPLPCSIPPP